MPIKEIEKHPYLKNQIEAKDFSFERIEKLIIGTFPVYQLTESNPTNHQGHVLREKYLNDCYFKYFYGSKKNKFWEFVSTSFGLSFPNNEKEAIRILNQNNILLTDSIKKAQREKYSPSDSDLCVLELNDEIIDWLKKLKNLRVIIFTSDRSKELFYMILRKTYKKNRKEKLKFQNKEYQSFVLPTPSGNGRTVKHFFNDYPINDEENSYRKNKKPYSYNYRKRIYKEVLKF